MSVIEIGSVWDTSRLNPYREPRLVFIEAKLQLSGEGANKNDNFLVRNPKGRDVEIRQNFHCSKIYVSRFHTETRLLKINKASVQFCFQSTFPEYASSIFKRDNPCLKITRCTLYTREQEEIFEKKKNAFLRSPAKIVILDDD